MANPNDWNFAKKVFLGLPKVLVAFYVFVVLINMMNRSLSADCQLIKISIVDDGYERTRHAFFQVSDVRTLLERKRDR